MHAYLVMTAGDQAGASFPLDPARENTVGRDPQCTIVLSDPRCSRLHAVFTRLENGWHMQDSQSRNGTFVEEQRVAEAMLVEGQRIRIGTTRFGFHEGRPPALADFEGQPTQTLVMETPVQPADGSPSPALDGEHARELLLLYQLSVGLVACDDPLELARNALELLLEQSGAVAAGFSEVDEQGDLRPRLVIPLGTAASIQLSASHRAMVVEQGHAVWVTNQRDGGSDARRAPKHCADSVCVPLVCREKTLGALHLYIDRARFRQSDFGFAISVSNLAAAALGRIRKTSALTPAPASPKEGEIAADADQVQCPVIVGECREVVRLRDQLADVAARADCALVCGPRGSGKKLLARALRPRRPLVVVDCAGLPLGGPGTESSDPDMTSVVEAGRDCIECFSAAHSGTLILAEIGQSSLEAQDILLRMLGGRPLLRIGENEELYLDARIIATSSRDLAALASEGAFRPALLRRLQAVELELPPLEARGRDIDLLADHFLQQLRIELARPELELSRSARRRLRSSAWPGNVRQLRAAIEWGVLVACGERIDAEHLPLAGGEERPVSLQLEHWQRKLIGQAIQQAGGNVEEAARLLGIGRATLYRKIEQYGIPR